LDRKVTVWAVAAGLVALIGLSCVYLGGGRLTDVLGGVALGIAWLFALLTTTRVMQALHRSNHHRPTTRAPSRP
jgi:membrane-associated phospholipid phosphatase